jgi:hypothetical protein
MKTLLVKSTILPNGERITWEQGMPVNYSREMIPEQYNAWQLYIDDQIMKIRRWTKLLKKPKVMNTVKPGGVCHQDGQESALKLAKEILR